MRINEKNEMKKTYGKGKLYIAIAMILLIAVCIMASYTPLMKIYFGNWVVSLVYKNIGNLVFLIVLFLSVFWIDRKRFYEKMEEGGDS